ncbi:MAG: aminopeptidase [Herminiimonas sp.]|nr:aminopeptidase [Herminiimonas sp.]
MNARRYFGWAGATALAGFLVAGCSPLDYYAQAAQGQLSLLSDARPIDDWLADPAVSAKLRAKLVKVKQIRHFAARELGLPDNRSYTSYADLKRPFVLWNVVATEELSLEPRRWCFPVAGCVTYRGYYSKADAQDYANGLRREGLDVQVAGVPAYSTLGWFNDPVLSTFIQYPDGELARLVFHELAHQVVYVKDDTQFNESFATAVEEAGVERWLLAQGDPSLRQKYVEYERRKDDFLNLLIKYRRALELNYLQPISTGSKRQHKVEIFRQLKDEYQVLKMSWGGYPGYDRWFAEPLTNAHLSSVATYHDFVPAFQVLLAQQQSLAGFYTEVGRLAALDQTARHQQLTLLGQLAKPAQQSTSVVLPRGR